MTNYEFLQQVDYAQLEHQDQLGLITTLLLCTIRALGPIRIYYNQFTMQNQDARTNSELLQQVDYAQLGY